MWADLKGFHFYQGFFVESLADFVRLHGHPPTSFLTSLEVLADALTPESPEPSAFIFHAGRCGSTLLSRVLARSRLNNVLSEAPTHNQIWHLLMNLNQLDRAAIFRKLLLATGRRRLESHRAYIVKFSSYNVIRFAQIRSAFPNTPSLFLFRPRRRARIVPP